MESHTLNFKVDETVVSGNTPKNVSNLIRRGFIMQQDNDPMRTANAAKDVIRGKKVEGLRMAKSIGGL